RYRSPAVVAGGDTSAIETRWTRRRARPTMLVSLAATPGVGATAWWSRMSPIDERRAQMFPPLSGAQVARIPVHGARRQVRRGEILFEQGDINRCFFVVLSGSVEIVQPIESGERTIVVHGPSEFTGEVDMLTGRPSLMRGRVVDDGEVLEVDHERL